MPHGRWKTITFVAGLRTSGVVAPFVLDGPINRAAFEAYVEKVLVPALRPGDVVILDNLSSHKGPSAASKDMLVERFQALASEVLMHPVHELVGRQRPIRLNDRPLAV